MCYNTIDKMLDNLIGMIYTTKMKIVYIFKG